MKKLFLFAAAAALMTACSETEVLEQSNKQEAIENQGGVKFDVYTQRSVTRGGTPNDITNDNIGAIGFGVFAYYTAGEQYSTSATPNFMYNQKVYTPTSPATQGTKWYYEPVKYWPNEYGNAAISDEVDYVSFFAYAPWTKIEPTTGDVDVTEINDQAKKDSAQNYNIVSVNKNTQTGDPIVKYVVDTNPATSVDLLWGVAAANASASYTPIDATNNTDSKVTPGFPFIDLVKPNDPVNDKLVFNLKHALAKVRVTIDYIADQITPKEGTFEDHKYNADGYDSEAAPNPFTQIIASDTTRIWVRQFKITGWAGKGALNLNNSDGEAGQPRWLDFDGVKELTFPAEGLIFQDGLKDGAEGQGKIDKGESLKGLHHSIIENAAVNPVGTDGKIYTYADTKNYGVGPMTVKTDGTLDIKAEPKDGTVLLFGGNPTENNGYFYVIPSNDDTPVDVTITYDVETIDPALGTTKNIFSDGVTKGSSIENIITKEDIFNGMSFEAGKQYDINIHIGMTSVKITATVTDWVDNGTTVVNLPNNQDPYVDPTTAAATKALAGPFGETESGQAYTMNGSFAYDEDTNTFTYTKATEGTEAEIAKKMLDDFARLIGSLYRNGGVTEITYSSTKYVWDDAVGLKGSNFYKEGTTAATAAYDKNTLMAKLTADFQDGTTTVTLETNKGSFILK